MELGDAIEQALEVAGITKERVEYWLGRPCGCGERQEKLNALSRWAKRVLLGRTEKAQEYLREITEDDRVDP